MIDDFERSEMTREKGDRILEIVKARPDLTKNARH
jgi:hypothetical protein